MEQFWGAVRCSLLREGCVMFKTGNYDHDIHCQHQMRNDHSRLDRVDTIHLTMFPFSRLFRLQNVSIELQRADIAIVNAGHHGTIGMEDVIKFMASRAQQNVGTKRKVFWSQTTQPHFPGKDGSFDTRNISEDIDFNQVDPSLMMCAPLTNRSQQFPVNAAAAKFLKQIDVQHNIEVLHFHQFSAGRWDMHGNWGGKRDPATAVDVNASRFHWGMDCLHLVFSPLFYEPQFGLLYEALERPSRP